MVFISTDEITRVQQNTEHVRNMCIIAHVDHGKTTLSDFLISSNGIISDNLAGQVRYMDSRPDEQEKLITMKSSSIALLFNHPTEKDPYIINLIDSPGHVDFSCEVSTAARLTDGALVVVDALEGVCTQTRTVLQQAFKENIKPCLVLNKIDRLITEKQMTPLECYRQLNRILEQVNVLMTSFSTAETFKTLKQETTSVVQTDIDSNDFFSPQKGNVVFTSAMDGWAFRINDFAEIFHKKLGMKQEVLQKVLWGDVYFNKKTKGIKTKATKPDEEPMFVQFILQNIYNMYDAIVMNRDDDKIQKIIASLQLQIPANVFKKADKRKHVRSVLGKWLPLSDAVLRMVCECLPSPAVAQRDRILQLVPELENINTAKSTKTESVSSNLRVQLRNYRRKLKKNLLQCDKTDDSEVMIFVSKMLEVDTLPSAAFSASRQLINIRMPTPKSPDADNSTANTETEADTVDLTVDDADNEDEAQKQHFVGFCRIYSGSIKIGQKLHVLGPLYNASHPDQYRHEFVVESLFLIMGRGLEPVEEVPAGNIFGLGGVSKYILKSATIASSPLSPIFSAMYFQAAPIVRFAIEPQNLSDLKTLVKGLKLLNQSDPSVEVYVQETGEHVIVTAGEVHAERCLRDLNDKFARVPLHVSPPLVSFKETIIKDAVQKKKVITAHTSNRQLSIKLKISPLPENISRFIDEHREQIKLYFSGESEEVIDSFLSTNISVIAEMKKEFEEAGPKWAKEFNHIWCLGPKRVGPNILLNHIKEYQAPYFKSLATRIARASTNLEEEDEETSNETNETEIKETDSIKSEDQPNSQLINLLTKYDSSFITGLQLATTAGPLCDEPMYGVCFSIEEVIMNEDSTAQEDVYGPFGGQIMSAVKDGCRKAFDACPRRLVEALYKCEIQATTESVGRVYEVLRKRRAKIIGDDVEEGTGLFIISCYLPVAESFGFIDELRNQTSGAASPQLAFSHWQTLEVDPFYVPKTEEELEEWGEHGIVAPNIAKQYIDNVRKRKGLMLDKKIVENAEKQRNMSRNK